MTNKSNKIRISLAIVNHILGNPSDGFNEKAADINNDNKITITDAVSVVNIILNQDGESAAPARQFKVETEKATDLE